MALVDDILELKARCRISEEIGAEYGLGERDIVCLCTVGSSGRIHSKTLSSSIGLSASRGSRVVSRLVDRGFLESEPDRGDRRYVNLALSEQGSECVASIERRKSECEQRMLAGLSEAESDRLREGIALLLDVM